jgi:hypothetical protein
VSLWWLAASLKSTLTSPLKELIPHHDMIGYESRRGLQVIYNKEHKQEREYDENERAQGREQILEVDAKVPAQTQADRERGQQQRVDVNVDQRLEAIRLLILIQMRLFGGFVRVHLRVNLTNCAVTARGFI